MHISDHTHKCNSRYIHYIIIISSNCSIGGVLCHLYASLPVLCNCNTRVIIYTRAYIRSNAGALPVADLSKIADGVYTLL